MTEIDELVVIGTGPAGLAAGLFAGRRGVDLRLFEKERIGGELANRSAIEDVPGVPATSGTELRTTLSEQVDQYDVPVTLAEIETIAGDGPYYLRTEHGEYPARCVIVACGGRPRQVDRPDVAEYRGRGVFYCAACDGPLYRDEVVAVLGSDDWALTDALHLADYADRVVVIEEGSRMTGGDTLVDRVRDHPAIETGLQTRIQGVEGGDVLRELHLVNTESGEVRTETVDGLYVQRGIEPATEFLEGVVPLTESGAVVVDETLETDRNGIFAAGDVRQGSSRTIAGAFGDGVTAFHSALNFLQTVDY